MKNVTFAAAASLILATPVLADGHMATAEQIKAAIPGNTVEGGMSDGAAYSEFYQADGAIKASGYGGYWGLVGNKMCFDYGEGVGCWNIKIEGDKVTWMNGDTAEGTGTIQSGNPNSY
ncbi:MAG: hypothetical protein AB8B82_02905 [Roseovarius sp.]